MQWKGIRIQVTPKQQFRLLIREIVKCLLCFFFFTLPKRLIKETFRHERSVETLRHMLLSEE